MQRYIYRLLLCICTLTLSAYEVKAIDEKYAALPLKGNQIATDSTSMVMDTVYFNPSLKPLQTTFSLRNLITFQIDESYRGILPDYFIVRVYFDVHFIYDDNGTPTEATREGNYLDIGYSKNNPYGQKAYYTMQGGHKAEVKITGIEVREGDVTIGDILPALMLTNEIMVNREYSFSCTGNAIQSISNSTTTVSTKGELKVFWQTQRAADEYDLEWSYIDSSALANYYKTGSTTLFDPKKIFTNNATRVSITTEEYYIPLLYEGKGSLFYRVRAVQLKGNGQRIESVWSSDYSGGLGKYDFLGLDTTLNWQASTSFAEEGKRKSVVQYFDGSLKSRQTVTKDNTTDTTLVAETFYDNQGRPVIQVMPTPSLSSIVKYTPAFNKLNGAEYTKDAYDGLLADTCHCKTGAPAMDTSSGAALYYSPDNPLATTGYHRYIPNANGFAFAETRYLPDNTGRISVQGGVSDSFRIGSHHETDYTYGSAEQEELDALFGTEVGNYSHYFKNTVRDANGQVSISYVDMHGRTIATALAGRTAADLDTLDSNKPVWLTKKLIDSNSNVIKGMTIESTKGLTVSKGGPHRFIYSLLPDSISIKDCNNNTICYDCIYDLEIRISDECNDTSFISGRPIVIKRTNYHLDQGCNAIDSFPAVDTTVYLQVGTYVVTKSLTINKAAMQYYLDSVFLVHNTCQTLTQFISEQKQILSSTIQCESSCDSCQADMASRIEEQMLADVTAPFGQYANPDSVDQYSVFWSTDNDPAPYKTVWYYDETGNTDTLYPAGLSQDQFVAEFKNSWAKSLLLRHPEYPKLQKYKELSLSHIWDYNFQNTATFQAAVDSGFLNPGDFTTHPSGSIFNFNSAHQDPLFTYYLNNSVASSYKSRMEDSLNTKANDTSGNSISMWALATIMSHCPDKDVSCLYRYKSNDSAFAISGCTGDLDIAWQYFREMYLQEKREILALILNEAQAQSQRFPDLSDLVNNHAPNFYDPNMLPPGGMPADSVAGRDSLNVVINKYCLGYAEQWWNELNPCNFTSADSAIIFPRLLEVCRQGGDENHLFGSSSVKPTSTYQYKTFEDVLKAYVDSVGSRLSYNSNCNVYLISAPQPYDKQSIYTEKPIFQKPDSCECATITSLYQQYQLAGKDTSFADYLYRTTGTRMYPGVLDTLRMACAGQINCSFLKAPLSLPPALQCGAKNICVNCLAIDTLYSKYTKAFPDAVPDLEDVDSLQRAKNKLFEQYMNTKLGFSKPASEYLQFMDQCRIKMINPLSGNCDTLSRWLYEYKRYGHIPHLDSSHADISHWSLNYRGFDPIWDYTIPAPLADVISNGVMMLPKYYTDTATAIENSVWFNYVHDTICVDTAGFTWETRIKLPDSVLFVPGYSTFWNDTYWVDFFTNLPGRLQISGAPVDGEGAAICAKRNDTVSCADLIVPGQHFNDWKTVKVQIRGRTLSYFIGDTLVGQRTLLVPITSISGWSFRFFSLKAQVDYIRIYDTAGRYLFDEEFDDPYHLAVSRSGCTGCENDFTTYFNTRNNSSLSYSSINALYAGCGLSLTACDDLPLLCGKTEPVFAPVPFQQRTACADTTLFAVSTGTLLHDAYTDSVLSSFTDKYIAKCLSARYHERFTLYQPVSEYHYTLYYYDQAGNLIKTVPPQGVDVSKFGWAGAWSDSVTLARRNKQKLTPRHTLETQYRFNTLNQVVAQKSPDGGLSEFWYDRLGRLAISRNARQKAASGTEDNRLYSYTQYDSLGRITEVGQLSNISSNGAMTDAISRNPTSLNNWLLALSGRRGQITNTIYDVAYDGFSGVGDPRLVIGQRNLRNRVSYTTLTDTSTTTAYNQATFYTYDILGNVDTLLQDYGSSSFASTANVMNKNENRWKKTAYKYDLISGKVNMVMFQRGWKDGFFHRYSYDAENRLTLVETSTDSLIWEKDARYEYYRHGPLARVIIGEQQVQGLDYAYTLQGWLKGINSTGGTTTYDMGGDGKSGNINQYTARDAIGLTLNYFANDYGAISGTHSFPGSSAYLPSGTHRPLYNGNIASMSVYQRRFENESGGPLIFYNYKYDQLNRLTAQDAYKGNGYNKTTGWWDSLPSMGEELKERIAYDANGNIKKYLRNAIGGYSPDMDSLNYYYYAGTNRLKHISDNVDDNTYQSVLDRLVADIDNQPDSNYVYDEIGNLIKDSAEKITNIKWNVYGKIQEITKLSSGTGSITNIKYTYDALGNRISKTTDVGGYKNYTWYVRDAQGNLLSTYSAEGDESDLADLQLKQTERYLYGSSRLGVTTAETRVYDGPEALAVDEDGGGQGRGYKQYELTNHLGNVLAVVSDKKFGVPSDTNSSLIDSYEPDIVSAQDYYPFGMPSRVAPNNHSTQYRFGFNGKEQDNDVKGFGGQQDYGMRIYDPRVGRFLSVDPLTSKFPSLTPYQFSSNSPIANIDLDGAEKLYYTLTIKDNKPVLTLTNRVETYKTSEGKQAQFPQTYFVSYGGSTYTFNQNSIVGGKYGNEPENTTGNLEAWYYAANSGVNVPSFSELFYSDAESESDLAGNVLNEWAEGIAMAKSMTPAEGTGTGTIYEVPGTATRSGRPYVGRHNQPEPNVTRRSNDGRDRTQARVIDRYNADDPQEGAYKEQKAIDARGGKQNLDNKRNEVNPVRMERLERIYGGRNGSQIRIVLPQTKQEKSKAKEEERNRRMQKADEMIKDHF